MPLDRVGAGMDRMALRGPDDQGLFSAPGVALGHRRLSIIDLRTGQQPLVDPATGTVVVFNGEIYNYRGLREELIRAGRTFRTASDTEVLLQACLEWGVRTLDRLSGMYAFAVYEPAHKRLFLARDRLGIKPLFYSLRDGRLFFASSMSALLCFPEIEPVMDPAAVSHYLTTLRTTMDRRTLIKGVCALLPGEYLVAGVGNPQAEPRRYWDIPVLAPEEKENPGIDRTVERVSEMMTDSIREQLISDVPLGGFLSGGLDSSVIASLANRLSGGRFDAYSVGYDIDGYNEWPFVRAATAFHDMDCKEIHLKPEEYPADWKFLIGQKGLPISTSNEIPIYHLARALKKDFTVALSGEGADEIFGGYVIPYFASFDYDRARHSEPAAGEELSALDRAMRRLYRRPFLLCHADQHFILNSWISFAQKRALLTRAAWDVLGGDEEVCGFYEGLFDRFAKCSTLDNYMHVHARVNLEGLLFRVDSSTMAASVEGRVPYTDHRIVEYLFSLPDHYKIDWKDAAAKEKGTIRNVQEIDRDGLVESKLLLRRAFAANVPREILDRPKMSFPVPVREWLGGFMKDFAAEAIRDSALAGTLFDAKGLDQVLQTADTPLSGMALWPVTNLCLWQKELGIRYEA